MEVVKIPSGSEEGTIKESLFRQVWRQATSKKSIESMMEDVESTSLPRKLTLFDLLFLGIGSIFGTGIFVLSGIVAANNAGPAVIISFIIASFVVIFSALCYCESTAMIPISGSAYSFTYATMGELLAFTVGWLFYIDTVLGISAVSIGWSGYLVQFLQDAFKITCPKEYTNAIIDWNPVNSSFELNGNYNNLPAVLIISVLSILLIIGTKESVLVVVTACIVKLIVIFLFIFGAGPSIDFKNFVPFIPPAIDDYPGHFGVMGILKGSTIVFFCFAGFASIPTIAQEAKNPQRDIPRAVLGSVIASLLLYILVSFVLIGIIPYHLLNVSHPITLTINYINKPWLSITVGISAVVGILTSIMTGLLSQSRIFFIMGRDGLLPSFFSTIHPRFGTPYWSQIVLWISTALVAGFIPIEILSILTRVGGLMTYFLVNASVLILRIRRPDLPRPFKVPFGPYLIPCLGIICNIILIISSSYTSFIPLFIYVIIGIIIYVLYSRRHSHLYKAT